MSTSGVVVSWLFARDVDGWFALSLANLLHYDAGAGRHIVGDNGGLISAQSGPRVAEARNRIIDSFAEVHPQAEWLAMFDSDMTFDSDIIERMLEVADPDEVPILGTLCFAVGADTDGPYPTIYREVTYEVDGKELVGVTPIRDYPRDTLVKCGATGAAGLLIHRSVLARMNQPWPTGFGTREDGSPNPYPWFSEGLVNPDGRGLGEDVAFCRRASLLGIPTHVHTGIKMGHVKQYKLDEDYFLARQREAAAMAPSAPNRAARRQAARNGAAA